MQELISVIVPVYNVENYLGNCVDSILNQTYKNLEIILIDDGSTDTSGKICDNYSHKNSNITVIHKKNGGLSDARNSGIDIANGKYISFIDSDDSIDECYFETLYGLIKNYDCDMSLVFFKRVYEDGTDKDCNNEYYYEKCFSNVELFRKYYESETGPNVIIACNKLYKKSLFDNIRFPFGKLNEDEGTIYKVIFATDKIAVSNKKLYFYLQRNNSIMNSKFTKKNLDALEFIREKSSFFKKNNLNELYEMNQIYYLKSLVNYCQIAKKHNLQKNIINSLKNEFFKEFEKINTYNSINTKEKKEIMLAKISFSLYISYKNIINKTKRIKPKSKRLIKKFIENNNFLYELFLDLKDFSFKKYKTFHNEYKQIENKLNEIHKGNKKAIILISTPSHGNLGDQAIVYSQYKFFEDLGLENQICEISEYLYDIYRNKIKHITNKDDLIVIDGGGSIGTLWSAPENRILNIVLKFSENSILIFPQSTYFINNSYGKNELKKVTRIFNNHSNLYFMLRDESSYKLMQKHIEKNVFLVPDIVLYLKNYCTSNERNCILTMKRNDHEGNSSKKIYSIVKKLQIELKLPTEEISNIKNYKVLYANRENELLTQFNNITKAKVLITDRLHGMIFAVVTNTPCIVFDNINKKISGVYSAWLKNYNNIYIINETEDINYEKIKSIIRNDSTTQFNNKIINEKFNDIKKLCDKLL